ncbi:hypothetical protein [Paenibacillus puerhi]|uniref:hypothetical protein n=1 Tax=Paenibacillus puerhi TaxID=2692622 RepID=UPI001359926D|nr:hypothetical protein [Paenibacillus puerhi]
MRDTISKLGLFFSLLLALYICPSAIAITYDYDESARLERVNFINNDIQQQIHYTYDSNGNLISRANERNNITIFDSSFEISESPWAGVSPASAFFIQTNTVKEGQRSIQFHSETPTVATADYGRLEVTGNTTYTLSAWIMNKTTAGHFYIDWLEYNEEGIQIYDGGTLYTPVCNAPHCQDTNF